MKVLLTGANGFLGQAVVLKLSSMDDIDLVVSLRDKLASFPPNVKVIYINNIDNHTDWTHSLIGVDVVIHAAGRAHSPESYSEDELNTFRRINVQGSLNLALQSISFGIKRFIFISSIKVNGDTTKAGIPFTSDDLPSPSDSYGVSKMEAESALKRVFSYTDCELVIIRPVLIYGPKPKGNFNRLIKILSTGIPLPFGGLSNPRSLVGIDNLIDLIVVCITHPNAANNIFLISDGEDISISELIHRIALAMNKNIILFNIWPLLVLISKLFGKKYNYIRLFSSLQVDIGKTCEILDWFPPHTLDEGLKKTLSED